MRALAHSHARHLALHSPFWTPGHPHWSPLSLSLAHHGRRAKLHCLSTSQPRHPLPYVMLPPSCRFVGCAIAYSPDHRCSFRHHHMLSWSRRHGPSRAELRPSMGELGPRVLRHPSLPSATPLPRPKSSAPTTIMLLSSPFKTREGRK